MKHWSHVLRAAVVCATSLTCAHFLSAKDEKASRLYEETKKLSDVEANARLRRYPLDEQLEAYVWGLKARHPPDPMLGYLLMDRGAPMAELIVQRLEQKDIGPASIFMIGLLAHMCQKGYYPSGTVDSKRLENVCQREWRGDPDCLKDVALTAQCPAHVPGDGVRNAVP